jgi:hypothetical protein
MTARNDASTDPHTGRGALLSAGLTAGASVVDAQVATYEALAGYQEHLADKLPRRWLGGGMRAQADLTRTVTGRYASTTRGLFG